MRSGRITAEMQLHGVADVVLSPTVAAAGGAVGAAALTGIVAYKVTKRQVVSSETVARAPWQHELDMAKETAAKNASWPLKRASCSTSPLCLHIICGPVHGL